ncbi:Retrovirus-related Pol polyprotein from transposon 17.6 [Dictyocoela muelleri]|nr:Retrovirus-related Pol polyprotein from transposon 17.6 [Dictyocoela muelleri]
MYLGRIQNAPRLSYPKYNETFYIEVDASEKGIGGVLYQKQGILGFFSYEFTPTEENYSVVEKETFAIYKMLLRFKTMIFNGFIILKTDNRNSLYKSKEISSRINRWREIFNDFTIEIQHIEGKKCFS